MIPTTASPKACQCQIFFMQNAVSQRFHLLIVESVNMPIWECIHLNAPVQSLMIMFFGLPDDLFCELNMRKVKSNRPPFHNFPNITFYPSSSLSLSSSPGWMKNTMRVMSSLSVSCCTDTTVSLRREVLLKTGHFIFTNNKYQIPDLVPETLATNKSTLTPLF